jgi:branched-chain amino acid transport system substrate-binding protein
MLKFATVAATLFGMMWSPANSEMNGAIRIGVLNDMSSVYSDFQGPGSVVAAQMAAEEFAKQSKRKVEILSADHQNKPDIGAEIARRWFDVEGVDMIIDVPNSAVVLAVADIARLHGAPHRREMLAQYPAMDLRHLGDGARRGARAPATGRQDLVLRHR